MKVQANQAPQAARTAKSLKSESAPQQKNAILDFYESNTTGVHVGGGALIGAGLARFCGLPSEAIISAATTGAVAGWFANDKKQAMMMGGGAALGAAIGALAGLPGAGIVSAAGTGTLAGWFFS